MTLETPFIKSPASAVAVVPIKNSPKLLKRPRTRLFETRSMCWLVEVPRKRVAIVEFVVAAVLAQSQAALVDVIVEGIVVTIVGVPSVLKLFEVILQVGPAGPVAPVNPIGPIGPAAPVAPTEPVAPVNPIGP